MPVTAASRALCDMKDLRVAIFEQQKLIEYEMNLQDKTLPTYMNSRVPDGGVVDPHDDGRTLQMRTAFQAPFDYNSRDHSQRDLVEITQEAALGGSRITIGTLGNEHDPNAVCDGVCLVDFAQGYDITGSQDYDLQLATPERCMEQLARNERRFVDQYLNQEARSFVNVTMQSHDHHLYKLSVLNGGANASVRKISPGYIPRLTSGGWDEVANEHVTIWWLEHYHRQILQRKVSKGHARPGESFITTYEVTKDCLKNMLIRESIERSGPGGMFSGVDSSAVRVQFQELMHETGILKGRQFYVYNNMLRFEFNDYPIRGYCLPTGESGSSAETFEFIRVYHLKNVAAENGAGSYSVVNPDYYYDTLDVDGQSYQLQELIPQIDRESFKTFGLSEAIGPNGKKSAGNKFQLRFLDGADLGSSDCPNFFDNKYRYAARDHMRWQNIHPEYSGWIMHSVRLLGGYDMQLPQNNYRIQEGTPIVSPEDLDNCDVKEECQSGPFVDCDADVVPTGTSVFTMTPCGAVDTSYYGSPNELIIRVERSNVGALPAASVDWTTLGSTAVYNTHYTPLDEAGDPTTQTGTLDWAAGEYGVRYICIRILSSLTAPTEAVFNLTLDNPVGGALGECDSLDISIQDRR